MSIASDDAVAAGILGVARLTELVGNRGCSGAENMVMESTLFRIETV